MAERRRRKKRSSSDDRSEVSDRVKKKIMRASDRPHRFRGLFYGRSGAGKTRLVASAPNCLVIDVNEEGWDSIRKEPLNPHTYEVKFWTDLTDVFWFLQEGDHEFESVALDGLTAMQDLAVKFVLGDEASRDASRDPDMMDRRLWNKVGELMKTQITNYRNLPMNVLFTATERKTQIGDEDDDDVEVIIGPALTPSAAGAAERAVGVIGYLHKRQVNVVSKKGGKRKKNRVVRRRLIIDDPTERYITKDRYHFNSAYIDAPDLTTMIADAVIEEEA